jgi:alkylation response protein AidB-like acyl-CoA dehydrogenase
MVPCRSSNGGRGANLIELAHHRGGVLARRRTGRVNQNGIFLLGPTLMEFGTPEQVRRVNLPKMAAGEEILGSGLVEPNAGSDMAAIVPPRATTASDDYCSTGRRRGCSRAAFGDWSVRQSSAPTRPPSGTRGLHDSSSFRLRSPACTSARSRSSTARAGFAEVFFEDARVPVAIRLGGENEGWKSRGWRPAGFERGLMAAQQPARFQSTAARLVDVVSRQRCLRSRAARRRRARRGWTRGRTASTLLAPLRA